MVASGVQLIAANSIVWWSLIVEGDVRHDTSEVGKASQSHRLNDSSISPPQLKTEQQGRSCHHFQPKVQTWCLSLAGPCFTRKMLLKFQQKSCCSEVQCAGADLFVDPSLLLALLFRFDSPPCLLARPISWGIIGVGEDLRGWCLAVF